MESRKRLRPWLWKHVDAGDYGLKWVNKEDGIFQIPWMRKNNPSWNQEHCQVFKEWAKFTNRYNDGEVEDYPGWKTRLRTALTKLKKDFEEINDMHNLEDTENPYKVYRFKNIDNQRDMNDFSPSSACSPISSQSSDVSQSSPFPNISPRSSSHQGATPYIVIGNIPNIIESDGLLPGHVFGATVGSGQSFADGVGMTPFHQHINIPDTLEEAEMPSLPSNLNNLPADLQSLDSSNLLSDRLPSSEIGIYNQVPDPTLEEPQQNPEPRPKIAFKVFYLDEIVLEGKLYDNFYHFYFGVIPSIEVSPIVYGPAGSERIELPDVNTMKRSVNSAQLKLLQGSLREMDRGFLLQCHQSDIYAQRLCRTRIFATGPFITNVVLDRKSKEATKIFDFTQFKEYHLGDDRKPPLAILTFAQEMKFDSLKTLLMRIELTSLEAQEILPPSNANSLQISDLNSGDQELLEKITQLDIQDNINRT